LHTGEISLDVRYYGNWCPQHSYCADMGGCTSVRYTVDWGPLSTSHSGPHGEVLGSYPVTPGNGSQSPDPNICGHLSYPGIGEIVQETDGAGNYWWQFSVSFSYGLVNWGRIYKKDCGTDKYACAYGVYTGEGEDVTYHASCPNCSPGVGSPHQISVSKA
jgi:hypothetical protein